MIRHPPRSTLFPTRRSSDLVAGLARLGAVSNFIAKPVLRGFALGLALTIVVKQIPHAVARSEEHTSELQSQSNLVCRLLLEKKKNKQLITAPRHNTIRHMTP